MCWFKMPKIQSPSVTAQQLVPSTESKEPTAPTFGGDDDWDTKAKRRGTKALRIDTPDTTDPLSGGYRGGMSF